MQAIFDFFTAIGDFITMFAQTFTEGANTISLLFQNLPTPIIAVVGSVIAIYATYSIIGRGGK